MTVESVPVGNLALSPEADKLAIIPETQTIEVRDLQSGVLLQTLGGHIGEVFSLLFSPDGTLLAAVTRDDTVWLWSLHTGDLLGSFREPTGNVNTVAFTLTGTEIALGLVDGKIRLWDIETKTPTQTLEGHISEILSLTFSANGLLMASAAMDDTIRLWDLRSGKVKHILGIKTLLGIDLALSPDGTTLTSGASNKIVQVWNTRDGTLLKTLEGYADSILGFAVSPDGIVFVSHVADSNIYAWDIRTGQRSRIQKLSAGFPSHLAVSADGTTLASEGGGAIRVWDIQTDKLRRIFEPWPAHFTYDLALSPDGSLMSLASRNQELSVYNLYSTVREEPRPFKESSGRAYEVIFSPDGILLASLSALSPNFSIILWDIETGELVRRLPADATSNALTFSPDGKWLGVGVSDSIILWNVKGGYIWRELGNYSGKVNSLTVSPTGTVLASSFPEDGTIRLWDIETGNLLHTINHSGEILFSSDGSVLIGALNDGTMRLWGVSPQ